MKKTLTKAKRFRFSGPIRFGLAVAFALVATSVVEYRHRFPEVSGLTTTPNLGESVWTLLRPRDLLFLHRSTKPGIFQIAFQVRTPSSPSWIAFADDCLIGMKVNGQSIPLPATKDCHWNHPISLPSLPGFVEGNNRVEIELKNAGSTASLRVLRDEHPLSSYLLYVSLTLSLMLSLSLLPVIRQLSFAQLGGIGAAVLSYLFYFASTPYYLRANDAYAHLSHVRHIARGHGLPKWTQCGEGMQQELYYWSTALLDHFTGFSPLSLPDKLQLFALVAFTFFLVFSTALINRWIADPKRRLLFALLLAFWPSARFHSVRIGNDCLTYTLLAVALYRFDEWMRSQGTKDFSQAIGAAVGAWLTKANALALLPVIVLSTAFKYFQNKSSRVSLWKSIRKPACVMFLGLAAVLAIEVYKIHGVRTRGDQSGALTVTNRLSAFLLPHWEGFFTAPFPDPWHGTDRHLVWNYLFKTAIWGEAEYLGLPKSWAGALNLLLLALLPLSLLGALAASVQQHKTRIHLYLFLFFELCAIVAFRYVYPYSCANDFRYIYNSLPVFLCFVGWGMDWLEKKDLTVLSLAASGLTLLATAAVFATSWTSVL